MDREVDGSLTEMEMASNEEKANWSNGVIKIVMYKESDARHH